MIPSALSPEDRRGYFGVYGFLFLLFFHKFTLSGMVLNYSNTVDCAAVICQEPKSTSLFLCVKTDEVGKEDGKLRHQRWHEMWISDGVHGNSDKIRAKNPAPLSQRKHISGWKRVAHVWLKFKRGKHDAMEVLHWINTGQFLTFPFPVQNCRERKYTVTWWETGRNQCVVEMICSKLFTVSDNSCRLGCHVEMYSVIVYTEYMYCLWRMNELAKYKTAMIIRQVSLLQNLFLNTLWR